MELFGDSLFFFPFFSSLSLSLFLGKLLCDCLCPTQLEVFRDACSRYRTYSWESGCCGPAGRGSRMDRNGRKFFEHTLTLTEVGPKWGGRLYEQLLLPKDWNPTEDFWATQLRQALSSAAWCNCICICMRASRFENNNLIGLTIKYNVSILLQVTVQWIKNWSGIDYYKWSNSETVWTVIIFSFLIILNK